MAASAMLTTTPQLRWLAVVLVALVNFGLVAGVIVGQGALEPGALLLGAASVGCVAAVPCSCAWRALRPE